MLGLSDILDLGLTNDDGNIHSTHGGGQRFWNVNPTPPKSNIPVVTSTFNNFKLIKCNVM